MDNLDDAFQKAVQLHDAKKFGEAAAIYRDILTKDPANVTVMHLLALIAMQFDQAAMVLSLSEEGIKHQPNFAILHQDKATALRRMGRKDDALAAINRAIQLEPKEADFYGTLSSILRDMRQYDKSVEALNKAIAIKPFDAKYYNNLAIVYGRMGANEEALKVMNKYIGMQPNTPEGYNNRANIYKALRRYKDALDDYTKALSINPDIFMGKANKGITHLILGDYIEGWQLFEHRLPGNMPPEGKRFDPAKRWKGESAPNATLIVFNEQGIGDTVQFCRYVQTIRARVGKLILQVQPALIPLLKLNWPDLHIISEYDGLPEYDLQCPFMSLPTIFKTTVDTIPLPTPYLHADPAKVEAWKNKLPQDGKKRVGLVWAGNPDHMNDHWRSVPLAQLAPLWDVPNVHFYSLQKGDKALQELSTLPGSVPFTALGHELSDFSETAALIKNLDLLITVDTAPLHIAGALGTPAYALLQYDPDWRWLAQGSATPWYGCVTLFRQTLFGKWDGAIENLRHALAGFSA